MPNTPALRYIFWTRDEWLKITEALHKRYPEIIEAERVEFLDKHQVFEAQKVLPEDRQRPLVSLATMKATRQGIASVIPTLKLKHQAQSKVIPQDIPAVPPPPAVPPETNPYEAAFAPLVELIAAKVALRVQDLLAAIHPEVRNVVIAPEVRQQRKIRFAVIGPLGMQANDIRRAFPEVDFITIESSKAVSPEAVGTCDKIVGMTDFMNHPTDGMLRSKFPDKYHRMTGSVSAAKRLIGLLLHDMRAGTNTANMH